ncbi:MAG TPA: hypothetical protein VHL78_06735 [Actinomycetota bacterium]|nr:hypothetical protein [Actinomycetota bacterium]
MARATLWLAAAALAAGAGAWWALRGAIGDGEARGVVLAVVGVVLLAPPAVLAVFALALRALADLPRRLRGAPDEVRDRAAHIRRRAAELAEARGRGVLAGLRAVVRLWWAAASSRELLEVLSPAAVLLTPGLLALTAVAAVAAVLEIIVGLVALAFAGP